MWERRCSSPARFAESRVEWFWLKWGELRKKGKKMDVMKWRRCPRLLIWNFLSLKFCFWEWWWVRRELSYYSLFCFESKGKRKFECGYITVDVPLPLTQFESCTALTHSFNCHVPVILKQLTGLKRPLMFTLRFNHLPRGLLSSSK